MGHEVIIFGCIEGVDREPLQSYNADVLAEMPDDDEWPWLVRGMFALPAAWPRGSYRAQVIHFGASLKDEPPDRDCWDIWLVKFEALLRRLYWWSATVHLQTEFEPHRMFRWVPTVAAIEGISGDPPRCVHEWERTVTMLPECRG